MPPPPEGHNANEQAADPAGPVRKGTLFCRDKSYGSDHPPARPLSRNHVARVRTKVSSQAMRSTLSIGRWSADFLGPPEPAHRVPALDDGWGRELAAEGLFELGLRDEDHGVAAVQAGGGRGKDGLRHCAGLR